MTNPQQQAREILDRLAFVEFDRCLEIDLNFNHLPAVAGIYAILVPRGSRERDRILTKEIPTADRKCCN